MPPPPYQKGDSVMEQEQERDRIESHYDLGRRHRWEAAVGDINRTVGEAFVSNDGRVRPNTRRARGWTDAQARSYCEGWAAAKEEIRAAARVALGSGR